MSLGLLLLLVLFPASGYEHRTLGRVQDEACALRIFVAGEVPQIQNDLAASDRQAPSLFTRWLVENHTEWLTTRHEDANLVLLPPREGVRTAHFVTRVVEPQQAVSLGLWPQHDESTFILVPHDHGACRPVWEKPFPKSFLIGVHLQHRAAFDKSQCNHPLAHQILLPPTVKLNEILATRRSAAGTSRLKPAEKEGSSPGPNLGGGLRPDLLFFRGSTPSSTLSDCKSANFPRPREHRHPGVVASWIRRAVQCHIFSGEKRENRTEGDGGDIVLQRYRQLEASYSTRDDGPNAPSRVAWRHTGAAERVRSVAQGMGDAIFCLETGGRFGGFGVRWIQALAAGCIPLLILPPGVEIIPRWLSSFGPVPVSHALVLARSQRSQRRRAGDVKGDTGTLGSPGTTDSEHSTESGDQTTDTTTGASASAAILQAHYASLTNLTHVSSLVSQLQALAADGPWLRETQRAGEEAFELVRYDRPAVFEHISREICRIRGLKSARGSA